jgi:hypothetical protein
LVGIGNLFDGLKNWYDVAGNKLKSFVKGPIKILGNNNQANNASDT